MRAVAVALLVPLAILACGGRRQQAEGEVVTIAPERDEITVRRDDVPGLPAGVIMRLVAGAELVAGLEPGQRIGFEFERRGGGATLRRITSRAAPPAPMHDHAPRHGGVVAMVGASHLEVRAAADGRVVVYVTDFFRRPRGLEGATGSVTLTEPAGNRTLSLVPGAEALEARGPALDGEQVRAHVEVLVAAERLAADFVLPVAGGAAGAAGIADAACTPVAPRPQARTPRCALDFSRAIDAVALSPDGGTLLVAATGAGVSIWRLPAARLLGTLEAPPAVAVPAGEQPHADLTGRLVWRGDGGEVAVAYESRLVRYAMPSGRLASTLPGLGGIVRDVAWSPDGTRVVATAFYDGAAHVLDAAAGRELRRLAVEREGAAVAVAPDGRVAAVGSEAGPVALFDLAGQAPPRLLRDASRAPLAMAFVGGTLLAVTEDGRLLGWDAASGGLRFAVGLGGRPTALAAPRGGTVAAVALADGRVALADAQDGRIVDTLAWHGAPVLGVAWEGGLLVSGDADGRVALWDLEARQGQLAGAAAFAAE